MYTKEAKPLCVLANILNRYRYSRTGLRYKIKYRIGNRFEYVCRYKDTKSFELCK